MTTTTEKNFGPDFSSTPQKPANLKADPKPSPLKNLGSNSSPRSGVRKLTEDDLDKIEAWYHRIAKPCKIFHPRLHIALKEQAEDCAQAWFDLAEKNDKVRKKLLAFLEGGDWGKLIIAHLPLLIATLPESLLERFTLQAVQFMTEKMNSDDEEPTYENFDEFIKANTQ